MRWKEVKIRSPESWGVPHFCPTDPAASPCWTRLLCKEGGWRLSSLGLLPILGSLPTATPCGSWARPGALSPNTHVVALSHHWVPGQTSLSWRTLPNRTSKSNPRVPTTPSLKFQPLMLYFFFIDLGGTTAAVTFHAEGPSRRQGNTTSLSLAFTRFSAGLLCLH